MTEGSGVFTTPEPLRTLATNTEPSWTRPRDRDSRARACSTRGVRCDESSDTPVANPLFTFTLTHLRACDPRLPPRSGARGSESGENRRGHRCRRFVKTRRLVMTRGAFQRQGPFVGSGGRYSPGPATHAFAIDGCEDRWMTFSRHPGPCPDLAPYVRSHSGSRFAVSTVRALPTCDRREPRRSRSPFTRPCRPFGSAFDELLRDQASPIDFCNCFTTCGHEPRALRILAGTDAVTSFLF
jgi:hypothetical protein